MLTVFASAQVPAASPVVVDINAGYSFDEYAGSVAVGATINTPSTLFCHRQKIWAASEAWYLFSARPADPGSVATIHFDQPIAAVLTTKIGPGRDTNATSWRQHRQLRNEPATSSSRTALSPGCSVTRSSGLRAATTLRLDWSAVDPGDRTSASSSPSPSRRGCPDARPRPCSSSDLSLPPPPLRSRAPAGRNVRGSIGADSPCAADAMLVLNQLRKTYAGTPVFSGVDLQVAAGEFVAIVGEPASASRPC